MGRGELESFLRRVDPSAPPPEGAYVEPPLRIGDQLAVALQPHSTSRVLFVGQPGVGKSTELARLEQRLADRFVVLRPPIDALNLRTAGWTELVAFSALWGSEKVLRAAASKGDLRVGELMSASSRLGRSIQETQWVADRPDDDGDHDEYVQVAGPPRPDVVQRFRNDLPRIMAAVAAGPAQVRDQAAAVMREVEAREGKPVVLLWDGLERLSWGRAVEMFEKQVLDVKDLPCRLVATAPVWLSFQTFFGELTENFGEVVRLRALDPSEPSSAEFLADVIVQRGLDFEGGHFDLDGFAESGIPAYSGGILRQLLQLIAFAIAQALTDGQDSVTREAFERGRRRAAERWQYQLGPADFHELSKDDRKRSPELRARLLSLGALVEYEDAGGGLTLKTNPLVEELMKRRSRS